MCACVQSRVALERACCVLLLGQDASAREFLGLTPNSLFRPDADVETFVLVSSMKHHRGHTEVYSTVCSTTSGQAPCDTATALVQTCMQRYMTGPEAPHTLGLCTDTRQQALLMGACKRVRARPPEVRHVSLCVCMCVCVCVYNAAGELSVSR